MGNDSAFNRRARELARSEGIPLSAAKRILGVPDQPRIPYHPIDSVFSLGLVRTPGASLGRSAARRLELFEQTPERPGAIHAMVARESDDPRITYCISGRERRPQYDALTMAGFRRYESEAATDLISGVEGSILTMPDESFQIAVSSTFSSPTLINEVTRSLSTTGDGLRVVESKIRGVSEYSRNGVEGISKSLRRADATGHLWLRTADLAKPEVVESFNPIFEEDRAIDPKPRALRISGEQASRIAELHRAELEAQIDRDAVSFRREAARIAQYREGDTLFLHELRLFSESFGRRIDPADLTAEDMLAEPIFTAEISGGFLTWYPTVQGLSEIPLDSPRRIEGRMEHYREPRPYSCMAIRGLTWDRDGRYGEIGYTPAGASEVMEQTPLVRAIRRALA